MPRYVFEVTIDADTEMGLDSPESVSDQLYEAIENQLPSGITVNIRLAVEEAG